MAALSDIFAGVARLSARAQQAHRFVAFERHTIQVAAEDAPSLSTIASCNLTVPAKSR
jgi:hypothetical protein